MDPFGRFGFWVRSLRIIAAGSLEGTLRAGSRLDAQFVTGSVQLTRLSPRRLVGEFTGLLRSVGADSLGDPVTAHGTFDVVRDPAKERMVYAMWRCPRD